MRRTYDRESNSDAARKGVRVPSQLTAATPTCDDFARAAHATASEASTRSGGTRTAHTRTQPQTAYLRSARCASTR